MSGGFVKLYGSLLLGSSLMEESIEARWLFICFLAAADEHGFVRCQTTGAAARIGNLTHDQAQSALDVLAAPDPNSTTPDEDGRRIVRAEGGWNVVNYHKYREMRTESQAKKAERQRKWRARQASTVDAVDGVRSEVSASASASVEGVRGETVLPCQLTADGQVVPPEPPSRSEELAEVEAVTRTIARHTALSGKAMDELLWEFSEYKTRRLVRLDTAPLKWLKVTHDRILADLMALERAAAERQQQQSRRPEPTGPQFFGVRR